MVSPSTVSQTMTNLERRQAPRTTITGHAYVNIEPNNGGIVLNVSDGGLCFHSFDPVQRNGKVRFWFAGNNRRIEAEATLAWTDETNKGGLRFTALPAEAREHIRQWIIQSAISSPGEAAAPPTLPPHGFPARSEKRAAPKPTSVAAPIKAVSSEIRPRRQLSGFSRGLVTGLLVSAVVAGAFLFQNYRHEFGESLIRLGEQFASKPQLQGSVASATSVPATTASAMAAPGPPAATAVLPAAVPVRATALAKTSTPPEKLGTKPNQPVRQPEKIPPPRSPEPTPRQANLEPLKPAKTAAAPTTASPKPAM